jgi:hypothetical protein
MNQRIRQLSEQAHHSTRDELAHLERVHNRIYDLYESAAIYNEKFAKLIVRECLSIVEPTEDSGDEWCVTLKGTAQEIKEHFGIAE